jgi:hypothetical protein
MLRVAPLGKRAEIRVTSKSDTHTRSENGPGGWGLRPVTCNRAGGLALRHCAFAFLGWVGGSVSICVICGLPRAGGWEFLIPNSRRGGYYPGTSISVTAKPVSPLCSSRTPTEIRLRPLRSSTSSTRVKASGAFAGIRRVWLKCSVCDRPCSLPATIKDDILNLTPCNRKGHFRNASQGMSTNTEVQNTNLTHEQFMTWRAVPSRS